MPSSACPRPSYTTPLSLHDALPIFAKQIDADGGRVLVIQADSSDPGAIVAAVEQTVQEFGRIDILVNNAGVFIAGPIEEATVEQAEDRKSTRLNSSHRCISYAVFCLSPSLLHYPPFPTRRSSDLRQADRRGRRTGARHPGGQLRSRCHRRRS